MAGFEVTLYGRIWVTPEVLPCVIDLNFITLIDGGLPIVRRISVAEGRNTDKDT